MSGNKSKISEKEALKMLDDASIASRSEHKLRITTMIDGDVYDELKKLGKEQGLGYQTVLNMMLRNSLFNQRSESSTVNMAKLISALEKNTRVMTKIVETQKEERATKNKSAKKRTTRKRA